MHPYKARTTDTRGKPPNSAAVKPYIQIGVVIQHVSVLTISSHQPYKCYVNNKDSEGVGLAGPAWCIRIKNREGYHNLAPNLLRSIK